MRKASIKTSFPEMVRLFIHVIILRPLLKIVFGIRIRGLDNFDEHKQYVIVSNHNSHLDILLLFSLVSADRISKTHAVADLAYFSRTRLLFVAVNFLFQPVWITRGEPLKGEDPLKPLKDVLDKGDNLVLFPEGSRGKPGEMTHFKSGIGRLIVNYPTIPVIPVFLKGPERVLPKSSGFIVPFTNYVTIGPAQFVHGTHRDITNDLQKMMIELAGTHLSGYRGRKDQVSPKTIAVLGIDGSGKSTISEHIARSISKNSVSTLISDKIHIYENRHLRPIQPLGAELFRQQINDYTKHAKSLKQYKYPKITELLLRNRLHNDLTHWFHPRWIIQDGSPLLNLLAWSVIYHGDKVSGESLKKALLILTGKDAHIIKSDSVYKIFPELKMFWRLRLNQLVLPDMVILIDLPVESAIERILNRGKVIQQHENAEKLKKLQDSYILIVDLLKTEFDLPVIILNGDEPLEKVEKMAENVVSKLNE